MTAFNYLPYEKDFINYIHTLKDIVIINTKEYKIDNEKFLKNANYSRWKKQTINNFDLGGSLYKKLYYLYLFDNIDKIEFEWIRKNIKRFNQFINIERYINTKLKVSINHFKSFNYEDITPIYKKWLEGYDPILDAEKQFINHIKFLTLCIIQSFCYKHYTPCYEDKIDRQLRNLLIYNLSDYLNENYIKTNFKLDKIENIYQQYKTILSSYNARLIYDISELSQNRLEIYAYDKCLSTYTDYIKNVISHITETDDKKEHTSKKNKFMKQYLKGYDKNDKLKNWDFRLKELKDEKFVLFHYSERLNDNFVDNNMLKYYAINIIIKNNLNIKDIQNIYLNEKIKRSKFIIDARKNQIIRTKKTNEKYNNSK